MGRQIRYSDAFDIGATGAEGRGGRLETLKGPIMCLGAQASSIKFAALSNQTIASACYRGEQPKYSLSESIPLSLGRVERCRWVRVRGVAYV